METLISPKRGAVLGKKITSLPVLTWNVVHKKKKAPRSATTRTLLWINYGLMHPVVVGVFCSLAEVTLGCSSYCSQRSLYNVFFLSARVDSVFIHISWNGHVRQYRLCSQARPREDTHTDTGTHPCAQFIIASTVTGETFRGEERGALNNECEEPCYTADKPLKWHNLLPPLS